MTHLYNPGLGVTDSNRTSASTSHPTLVDDGTPAGHPTPAGEPPRPDPDMPGQSLSHQLQTDPASPDEPELFQGLHPPADAATDHQPLLAGVGALILAWGRLEEMTAEKLAAMRQSFGDVRAVGGRNRPTMQKLLAELRALVAMRDRHDKQALTLIAEIDGALQRTAQFRLIVVDGMQNIFDGKLLCRDLKNSEIAISAGELARETAQLERIRCQISGL